MLMSKAARAGGLATLRCLRATARRRPFATTATLHEQPQITLGEIAASPRFPGAVDSPLVPKMEFLSPKALPPISTYSIMKNASAGEDQDALQANLDISNEQILEWYKNMLFVNILDVIMADAQRQGRLSFYMVSAGEEAVMVGSAAALGKDDIITCQYRETGLFKQRGFDTKDFMSQLMHNKHDPGKGRNMPVHYSGRLKTGVHAVASTLGTQIPHATGAAYAMKLEDRETQTNSPRVAVAYFGDGAASEGDFHGALNLAAVRDCPVIFICRNNGFAISTPTTEQYRGDGIASRAIGYGIEAIRVDGTDIFAVYGATKEARKRSLEGGGRPILMEFMSYRISHHSTSDDSFAYRTQSDVDPWKSRDNPLVRLRTWLEKKGLWNEDLERTTRAEIRGDILTEMKAAEKVKKPRLSSVFDDVYASYSEEQAAQREELRRMMMKYPAEYDAQDYEGGVQAL